MKRRIVSFLLLCSLPLFAQDDKARPDNTSTSRPDIEELLTVMRIQKLTEDAMVRVKEMMAGFTKQAGASVSATSRTNDIQDKTFALVEHEMGWEQMKGSYIKIYSEIYSPDEVAKLIEFYKSPVGQMFLDKQPLLMQKTMEMTQKKMVEIMPKVQQLVKDEISDASAGKSGTGSIAGDHRKAATRVLEDLRLLDSATDQYAIETDKASGFKPTFADLKNYLKPGTTLYDTGADIFGKPYGPYTVDSIPKVSDSTFNALSDVADGSFWSPYK